ncbi:uncharacterized protein LOC142537627 [Primulina tabacum]|uniref:uncharacterized protein LOC142537627 n=1 Tax=Primulina tabacum TaxID=48773 RepID=UPI003F592926
MVPGGRGKKGKEVVLESEAQNVRGLEDIVRGRRGHPVAQTARNVEEEVNQEVEQLTQKVGGMQLKLAIYQLKDRAQLWWEAAEEALKTSGEIITWEVFCAQFTQEYAPPSYYYAKEEEFNQLVQGNKTVVEYASQFSGLLPYVPHVARNDQSKLSRFLHGLQGTIHTVVMTGSPNTYVQAVEMAKKIEASLLRGESRPIPVLASTSQGSGSHMPMPAGLSPYQPQQSSQQPKQQRFRAKGKQFKKKSQSSSSSSDSTSGSSVVGSSNAVYCDHLCPNAQRQQFQQQQSGKVPRGPAFRPYAPAQSFQQSGYPPPRGPPQQQYPVPQQARVHALTQDQAQDAPGGVIAGCCQSAMKDFFIYALDATREERLTVSDIPIVNNFPDVFPDEIPGHVISTRGVSVDPSKVEAVINWLKQTNVSEIRSFLGLAGYEKEISDFVARCLTCQQVKVERMRHSGMLHSLEVPQWNWEHIAMDFVTHLPRSNRGCDAIWVIVDRLSKSAHFIPYDRTFTYKKMAKMYIDHVVRLHGVPVTIVSDRDPRFASKFWGSLLSA